MKAFDYDATDYFKNQLQSIGLTSVKRAIDLHLLKERKKKKKKENIFL
jgi:hypothetical protein